MRDNLESVLYGIDVGLNRQRAQSTARESFFGKKDEEIDYMSLEDL